MQLPMASIVFAVIGCFLLMLTPVVAWMIRALVPGIPALAWVPVFVLPSGYIGLFVAYGRAHRDTPRHETSTFWLQFVHGLCFLLFASLAVFADGRLLGTLAAFFAFLLVTFYLSYLGLCLAVRTMPPFAAIAAFLVAVLSFVLTLMRLES